MMKWLAAVLLCLALAAPFAVRGQADVGVVTEVAGEVAFVPRAGPPGRATGFMKVRAGDRFDLRPGTRLTLIFYEGGRQETWRGPARFRAEAGQSSALEGAPADVRRLPNGVPQRIAAFPDLMQHSRFGGVQVRGSGGPRVAEAPQGDARATYERMRRDLPQDDITPELFLASALHAERRYGEMGPVVAEMLRKQPGNADARALEAWLKSRNER